MPSTVQAPTGRVEIDGLLTGARWIGPVNYGFPDSPSDYPAGYGDEPTNGFFAISAYQQDVVRYAFSLVQSYTNLSFTYAGTVDSDIAFGQTSLADTAYASYPDGPRGGDVWFGNDFRNPRVGDYAFLTHLHEIGHALGLKHPHETDGSIGTLLPAQYDSLASTVMSYRSSVGGPLGYSLPQFHFPTTFMPIDILALQTMYGADYTTNSGNTVYSWSPDTGQQFVNGVGQMMPGSGSGFSGDGASNWIFMTVWDGGGVDTFDLSNYGLTASGSLSVNLAPGMASPLANNGAVYTSFLFNGDTRSLIENVIGGDNRDYFTGNDANNRLEGRNGDDTLGGGRGNDALIGGAGDDQLAGGRGTDLLNDSEGYNSIRGGAGNDTAAFAFNFLDASIRFLEGGGIYVGTASGYSLISSVEYLRFADGTIRVSDIRPADTTAPTAILTQDNWAIRGPDQLMNAFVGLQFDEEVTLGSGSIRVYYSDGTLYRTFSADELWTDNDSLQFNYPTDEGQYYVETDAGIVVDAAGNPSAAISGPSAWNFFVGIRADDYPAEFGTSSGSLSINGAATSGYLSDQSDYDTFRVVVTPGQLYQFDFTGPGPNGAENAYVQLTDSSSNYLGQARPGETLYFTPTATWIYLRVWNSPAAGASPVSAGDYSLQLRTVTDDYADGPTTTGVIAPGGSISGVNQGSSDYDWIRVDLVAGQTYRFTLTGGSDAGNGLQDADTLGMILTRQEDGSVYYNPLPGTSGGAGGYSALANFSSNTADVQGSYTADRTGTYYVRVQGGYYPDSTGGNYTLDVDQGTFAPPVLLSTTATGGANATPSSNIVLTFDRAVVALDGFLHVGGQDIDVNDSTQVTIVGNVLTIDPAQDLGAGQVGVGFDIGSLAGADGTFATWNSSSAATTVVGYYRYYSSSLSYSDDYAGDIGTLGRIAIGGTVRGTINNANWSTTRVGGADFDGQYDTDWFRVDLLAGETYDISLLAGSGLGEPSSSYRDLDIAVMSSTGLLLAQDTGNNGGGRNSRLLFTAAQTGTYFVAVIAGSGGSGAGYYPTYELSVAAPLGITVNGTSAADTLAGSPGNDRIDGKAGGDAMAGGAGGDTYVVDNAGDVVTETASGGFDTVESAITYVLGANVERLKLIGTATINGTGNSLANTLTGNSAANRLNGAAGADAMAGGFGDDVYIVDDAGDTVSETSSGGGIDTVQSSVSFTLGAYVENLTLTGSAAINGTGNSAANVIAGNSAANVLNGGAGADRLIGGLGNDTYKVDNAGDIVVESTAAGTDTVLASVSHALRLNVENLTLTGASNISGKGNGLANLISGNSGANVLLGFEGNDKLYGNGGNDRLDGGIGADRMDGGLGNDTYVVDSAYDVTGEYAGEGTDTVLSSVSHSLRLNVENLTLTGTANTYGRGNGLANLIIGNGGANALSGRDGNDKLYGEAGNDRVDGGTGADRMYGGLGNDIYFVDNASDVTVEYAGEGTDTVYASTNYVIRDNVERLYLTGSADLVGKANEGNNLLVGNSGSNKLYGYGGNDRLKGGLGADLADGGAGNDALDGGAGNDRLYGGLGVDVLTGGDGLDYLQGGAGRDRMYGGTGADQYVFDDGEFSGVTAATADQIHDFNDAEGDRVNLSLVDANTSILNDQAFTLIGTSAFSGAAGQLRYEQISGNTYIQGDVDGDGTADFWIRLDGLHTLASDDFVF